MFNPSLTLNWKRVMGFQMGKQSSLQFWIHEKISINFVKIGQFRFGKLYLSCLYFHHYILCVFYSYFSPGKALLAGKGISRQVFFGESRFTLWQIPLFLARTLSWVSCWLKFVLPLLSKAVLPTLHILFHGKYEFDENCHFVKWKLNFMIILQNFLTKL